MLSKSILDSFLMFICVFIKAEILNQLQTFYPWNLTDVTTEMTLDKFLYLFVCLINPFAHLFVCFETVSFCSSELPGCYYGFPC